eukprot:scaffold233_cov81-Cylindrotheca_fusiformis.AAC.1
MVSVSVPQGQNSLRNRGRKKLALRGIATILFIGIFGVAWHYRHKYFRERELARHRAKQEEAISSYDAMKSAWERDDAKFSKYTIGYTNRTVVYCDGSQPNMGKGAFWLGSRPLSWYNASDPQTMAACEEHTVPRPVHDYCDTKADSRLLCNGSEVNTTYVTEYGAVGQDCWSWKLLLDHLSGSSSDITNLRRECSDGHGSHREQNTP